MLEGLKTVAKTASAYHIPFIFLKGSPEETIPAFLKQIDAGLLVTDFSPLRISKEWKKRIASLADIPIIEVDAHNIIPVWVTSSKQEYSAYTIRPKIFALLAQYLKPFPAVQKQSGCAIASTPVVSDDTHPYDWIAPGEQNAQNALRKFLNDGLDVYAKQRNDPNAQGQSQLSPYLHFGHICSQDIVLQILNTRRKHIQELIDPKRNGATTTSNEQAFIEELVVRKELSDNFCFYNERYDDTNGFPNWAKNTLLVHATDKREYLYTKDELEHANTHDELWNAAQRQMVATGKMHGYLRMYWAKKILEWTNNADEAMRYAIYLNDHYSLDGRDPNGYTGIAWSIGGVHDRPWGERPIFGNIRYMSYAGCTRKFNVRQYINTWKKGNVL
jgi:deoxyribodipyrimidine photo-lyase